MGEPDKITKPEVAVVEGLEELFSSTIDPPRTHSESTPDQGWTLTGAADVFNVTERTVRRWIKEQRISAWKVDGPRGPEWRINPGSTPDNETIHAGSTVSTHDYAETIQRGFIELLRGKDDELRQREKELQGANFRIGYLEAQLENHKEQIKLLTDEQHRGGRWERFKRWLTGGVR